MSDEPGLERRTYDELMEECSRLQGALNKATAANDLALAEVAYLRGLVLAPRQPSEGPHVMNSETPPAPAERP